MGNIIKTILLLLPVILSCLMQGAHFLRVRLIGLTVMWLSVPLVLLIKRRWVPYIVTLMLLIGCITWLMVTRKIWLIRMAAGMPATRMAVILCSVALFTLASSSAFLTKRLKERYKGDGDSAVPGIAAFLLTGSALAAVEIIIKPPAILLGRFIAAGGLIEVFWLAVYSSLLIDTIKKPQGIIRWRSRIWAFFSFIFFLQLFIGLAGFERFFMTGKLHLPVPALIVSGPVYRGDGYFMLTLFLATILFTGPAWCSWLCYIGSWDDICSRSGKAHKKLPKWRKYIRIGLLFMVVLAAYLLKRYGVLPKEAAYVAGIFGIVGVMLMLTWSRKTGMMTHCTAYCPIGFLSVTLGKINPFRIKIEENCTKCGECTEVCRYDALSQEDVEREKTGSSCTLCGDCISSCKNDAIHYSMLSLSHKKARLVFLIIIVAFHAVFLGVARL